MRSYDRCYFRREASGHCGEFDSYRNQEENHIDQ